MLYHAYEVRRAAIGIHARLLRLQADGLRALPGPLARAFPVRASAAAADLYDALQITHQRPDFGVVSVGSGRDRVPVVEQVVAETPFGSLVRFHKADGSSEQQPKVLIVPGLAGHFATLARGTVQTMLTDHDVYVADWKNARDVPLDAGPFGLDDFIEHLMDFLRTIGPDTHLMAICQPAVSSIAAAALMTEDNDPCRPASLLLLAGPVDVSVNPGRLGRFSDRPSIETLTRVALHRVPAPYAGVGRMVYPGFLQLGGFMGMDPIRHARKFRQLYRDLVRGEEKAADKTIDFYREYLAVLDIAAEFYADTIQRIFRDNDLARGRLVWRGRDVDPSQIDSALFTIEGALDEMCTPGQTEAAHRLCTAVPDDRRCHLLQDGVGHYGVFAGSVFDHEIYPAVRDFIAATAPLPDSVCE